MPRYAALLSAEGPGGLFATLESTRLIVRCAETKTLLRNIDLDPKIVANIRHLKWYNGTAEQDPEKSIHRLLLATSENVLVYDIHNPRWQANIKKACGDGGKIVSVGFGSDENEIIAFGAFGLKACIWSLNTGSAAEIRDPKIPSSKAHSIRASSGHLAVLTRPASKDEVVILSPDCKKVENTFTAATTDAQGIKWSPDGRWLVIWDTATAGTGVHVYTATGHLFKSFSGAGESEDLSFGVQRVEWDHASRYLIVMMNDGKSVFLSTRAFQPSTVLEYPSKIASRHAQIHEEQIAMDGSRSYAVTQHAITPPRADDALGFAHVAVSPSSSLLACVLTRLPTTIWIHTFHPEPQLTAVLTHHGAIKSLTWHPSNSSLLLAHSAAGGPKYSSQDANAQKPANHFYLWGYDLPEPQIIPVYITDAAITKAVWIKSTEPRALIGTATSCTIVNVLDPEQHDDETEFPTPKPSQQQKLKFSVEATPTQMLGYELETPRSTATSNFSPIKMDTAQLTRTLGFQFTSLNDSDTEDTFDFKRPLKLGT